MIELLFLGSAAFAGGAHAVRRSRANTRYQARTRRDTRRDSLLVKAWNSSGAPRTEETMLADALADLGGRAIGAAIRRRRQNSRSRQRFPSLDREVFFRCEQTPGDEPPRPSEPGGAAGKPPSDMPPSVLPAGRAESSRRSSIPMPPGPSPADPGSTGRGGAGPSGRAPVPPGGRGRSRTGEPARRGRGRRASVAIAVPLDLDAPDTDQEFLDTCADLQQMLRAVGVAVEDWNDDLARHHLPTIVTGPLDRVHEGLVDGAACVALASVLFENWFEEAREVGIEFTGDDPE